MPYIQLGTSKMTPLEYFRDHVIPDWELTPAEVSEMLGLAPGESIEALSRPDSEAARECLAALSRTHTDLRLFANDPFFAKRWLRGPNSAPLFAGLPPIEVLRRGDPAVSTAVAAYVRTALGYDYS